MKTFLGILLVGAALLAPLTSFAIGANAQYELNNRMGGVAHKHALGDLILGAGTGSTLANGKIWIGSSGALSVAQTLSGDVTTTNGGVTAIGSAKVTEAMIAPMGSSGVAAAGLNVLRTAHLVWDPTTVAAHRTGTAQAFGAGYTASIPANSLIVRVYFVTTTAVTSTGNNGTIAFNCLGAGDLLAAVDPDSTWGVTNGMGSGTITGIQVAGVSLIGLKTAAGCAPTYTVATNNFLGGRVHIFIDYVMAD